MVVTQNQRYSISEERNEYWLCWKSEGFIISFEIARQHNAIVEKEHYFVQAIKK